MNETQAVDLLLAGETVYTDTPAEYGAIARELRRQDDREFYHLSSVQNVQCCDFRIVGRSRVLSPKQRAKCAMLRFSDRLAGPSRRDGRQRVRAG
jgi:hypothetical protein